MTTVLAVDDDDLVREIVLAAVRSIGVEAIGAATVAEARKALDDADIDVVICDVRLPDASGLELIREIREQLPDTAVFMLSGVDDPDTANQALELGASAYVVKPFVANEIIINVRNSIRLRDLDRRRRRNDAALATIAVARPASLTAVLSAIADPADGVEPAEELAQRIAHALRVPDDERGTHVFRTSQLARELCGALGMDESSQRELAIAAMLHDVGKVGVPDDVLLVSSRAGDQLDLARSHTELGFRLLASWRTPVLQLAATVALSHHERWDGSGYPAGLAADAIPLEGRIVAVANVFDALTTDRPERPALPIETAIDRVLEASGTMFDPTIVRAFASHIDAMKAVAQPALPDTDATTVLVVDDHSMFAESVVRLLNRESDLQTVGIAATAADALATVRAAHPAVVLMDWELPDDDGVSAAKAILEEAPETKVVLLTGRADDSLVLSALRAGCVGFVSKIDAFATLVSAVRAAAAGEPAMPTGKMVTLLAKLADTEPQRGSRTRLSERELEVLTLVAKGLDVDAIASRLFLSGHTVRNHIRNAMAKLDAHSRLEAVTTAARRGLIDLG